MTFKILLIILYFYCSIFSIPQVFSLHTNGGVTCTNEGCKEIQNKYEMIKAEYNKLKLVIRRIDFGKFRLVLGRTLVREFEVRVFWRVRVGFLVLFW